MEQVYIVMFDNGRNYGSITYIIDIYASLDDAQQRVNQLREENKEEEEYYGGWIPYYVISRDVIKSL
jgi:hypothetical protein